MLHLNKNTCHKLYVYLFIKYLSFHCFFFIWFFYFPLNKFKFFTIFPICLQKIIDELPHPSNSNYPTNNLILLHLIKSCDQGNSSYKLIFPNSLNNHVAISLMLIFRIYQVLQIQLINLFLCSFLFFLLLLLKININI
jgi:hypothetical protein